MLSFAKKKGSIKSTVEEIKEHDLYQQNGRKDVFNNDTMKK